MRGTQYLISSSCVVLYEGCCHVSKLSLPIVNGRDVCEHGSGVLASAVNCACLPPHWRCEHYRGGGCLFFDAFWLLVCVHVCV